MSAQLDALRAYIAARPAAHSRLAQHVVVVASGKGGTGTSTVATLLAAAAARTGRETLLVDAGAAASSLGQLLGVDAPEEGAVVTFGGIALACARSMDAHSAADRAIRYRRLASAYASYGAVVVDAGATMDAVMLAAPAAGRIIAVTSPDRIGITATYALLKAVGQRYGTVPLGVLGNRCDEVAGLAAWERIAAGTDRFLGHAIGFAGTVPDDAELCSHTQSGRPFDVAWRGAATAAADAVIARTFDVQESRRTLSLIRN